MRHENILPDDAVDVTSHRCFGVPLFPLQPGRLDEIFFRHQPEIPRRCEVHAAPREPLTAVALRLPIRGTAERYWLDFHISACRSGIAENLHKRKRDGSRGAKYSNGRTFQNEWFLPNNYQVSPARYYFAARRILFEIVERYQQEFDLSQPNYLAIYHETLNLPVGRAFSLQAQKAPRGPQCSHPPWQNPSRPLPLPV